MHPSMHLNYPQFKELFEAIELDTSDAVRRGENHFRTDFYHHRRFQPYPYNNLERLFEMARPKKSKFRSDRNAFRFINFKFSSKERDNFDSWLTKLGNMATKPVYEMLQDDCKLSISYDAENVCFIAALTGKEDSVNEGQSLVVRAKDWDRALMAITYVHTVIFKFERWESAEEDELV